jgi:hypothetical protein
LRAVAGLKLVGVIPDGPRFQGDRIPDFGRLSGIALARDNGAWGPPMFGGCTTAPSVTSNGHVIARTVKRCITTGLVANDRFWRIVLKMCFLAEERNFLQPLMRFALGDVRDLIVLHKTTTDLRIGPTELCSGRNVEESTFARFSRSFDFRLFQHYRRRSGRSRRVWNVRWIGLITASYPR